MSVKPLRAPKGASQKKNIVGRGRSSGSGKTSGRGHKGQNSRSGGGVRLGFEGGQMPLYRRVAARGFSNHPFKKEFTVVNISSLQKYFENGETVSLETLTRKGLVKKNDKLVKILGNGDLDKKLNVEIPFVSTAARSKIEQSGGTVLVKMEQVGADGK